MKIRIAFTYDMPKNVEKIFRRLFKEYKKREYATVQGVTFSEWIRAEMLDDAESRVIYSHETAYSDLVNCFDVEPSELY